MEVPFGGLIRVAAPTDELEIRAFRAIETAHVRRRGYKPCPWDSDRSAGEGGVCGVLGDESRLKLLKCDIIAPPALGARTKAKRGRFNCGKGARAPPTGCRRRMREELGWSEEIWERSECKTRDDERLGGRYTNRLADLMSRHQYVRGLVSASPGVNARASRSSTSARPWAACSGGVVR